MGGLLADPSKTFPGLDAEWIRNYPYALPGICNFVFLSIVTAVVFLWLEEVGVAVLKIHTYRSKLTLSRHTRNDVGSSI